MIFQKSILFAFFMIQNHEMAGNSQNLCLKQNHQIASIMKHEMRGSPALSFKSKIDSDSILYQLEIIKFIHKLMIVSKLNRSLTRFFIKWLIHRQFLKFLRTKQRHFIAIDFHWIPVQHQIKISVVTFFVLIIFAISIFPQD